MKSSSVRDRLTDFGDEPGPRAPRSPSPGFSPLFSSPGAVAFSPATGAPVPGDVERRGQDRSTADAAALQGMLNSAFAETGEPGAAPPSAPPADPVVEPASDPSPVDAPEADAVDHEAAVTELREEMEALNSRHSAEIADLIDRQLPAMTRDVVAQIEKAVAAVLAQPLLSALEEVAVERFGKDLQALLSAHDAIKVKVSGPEPLLAQLRANWSGPPELPELTVSEHPEITAVADMAVISTRLEDMKAILMEGRR